jgi:hypothetical protein
MFDVDVPLAVRILVGHIEASKSISHNQPSKVDFHEIGISIPDLEAALVCLFNDTANKCGQVFVIVAYLQNQSSHCLSHVLLACPRENVPVGVRGYPME